MTCSRPRPLCISLRWCALLVAMMAPLDGYAQSAQQRCEGKAYRTFYACVERVASQCLALANNTDPLVTGGGYLDRGVEHFKEASDNLHHFYEEIYAEDRAFLDQNVVSQFAEYSSQAVRDTRAEREEKERELTTEYQNALVECVESMSHALQARMQQTQEALERRHDREQRRHQESMDAKLSGRVEEPGVGSVEVEVGGEDSDSEDESSEKEDVVKLRQEAQWLKAAGAKTNQCQANLQSSLDRCQ